MISRMVSRMVSRMDSSLGKGARSLTRVATYTPGTGGRMQPPSQPSPQPSPGPGPPGGPGEALITDIYAADSLATYPW